MYEKFYGFKEKPFGMTPDTKFFFPSKKHTDALDSLIYTVKERRGFAVITGEIGSGKTTICRTLLDRLDAGTKVAMITNTHLTNKQLISSTLEDLDISTAPGTKSQLLSRLNKFLIEQLSLGINVVLIIDEVQNLNLRVLEEVRMLSNLETEKEKLIQIILVGQPQLGDMLNSGELEQLRQRVCVQHHIDPLNRREAVEYISHRLRVARANEDRQVKFTRKAMDEIYAYSGGIPRLINMICDSALLIGYATETRRITPRIIREVEQEFRSEKEVDKVDKADAPEPGDRGKKIAEGLKAKKTHLKELESRLSQLTERLKKAEEENSQLQLERKEALSNYEFSLDQKGSELKDLIKKIELVKGKLWYLEEGQLKDLTSKLQAKRSSLEELRHSIDELKKKLKSAQEQNVRSQRELVEINQNRLSLQVRWQKRHREVLAQLKASRGELRLCESARSQRQTELDEITKRLKSSQETLSDCESKCRQRHSELQNANVRLDDAKEKLKHLEELTRDQLKKTAEELGATQLQIEEAKSRLDQLTEHLRKARAQMSQLQLEREEAERALLERQREWEEKEKEIASRLKAAREEVRLCASARLQREAELEELTKQRERIRQELCQSEGKVKKVDDELKAKSLLLEELEGKISTTKEELKDIQGKRDRFQRELGELNQAWLSHQVEWRRKEKEISGQFKSVQKEPTRCAPIRTKKQVEPRQIIKLRAKRPGDEATFLTAYTSDGEIKTDQLGDGTYGGIRIVSKDRYVGNYRNLNFFAKCEDAEGDQRVLFMVELKNIMMGIGKHYKLEVTRSWQKVIIPFVDFDSAIGLDIITEVTISLDEVMDGVIHINDIHFSNEGSRKEEENEQDNRSIKEGARREGSSKESPG